MASLAQHHLVDIDCRGDRHPGQPDRRQGRAASRGCNIKGNISYNTGERIYHVPGQQYYNETRISLWKGERWFCSEQDARKAGWRKSRL
ncbi:hypothetical protein [Mesorhizobium sp. SEMIA 3007]|uniref:sunset domain-containing protein n=1 Tax=Mesorhizobium sp. SEMIA 3007 TaxID=1862350 RepID=UPI001495E80E|nr:hypothetical protein [Mesorhizobium sp. SEMIA 3007]